MLLSVPAIDLPFLASLHIDRSLLPKGTLAMFGIGMGELIILAIVIAIVVPIVVAMGGKRK